jgi:putative Flp pilus-assembly TadE/G-like protein
VCFRITGCPSTGHLLQACHTEGQVIRELGIKGFRQYPLIVGSMTGTEGSFQMNKILRKPSGQVMVLYAGIIAVLLGAVGLCTDVGLMYINWQQLQKAADASALAGANYLPGDSSTAISTAQNWPVNNFSVLSTEIVGTPSVNAGNSQLSITLKRTVPYNFGKALGLTSADVQVTAIAAIEGSGGAVGSPGGSHLVPVGFECADPAGSPCASPGDDITLPGEAANTKKTPGNWGGLQYLDGQKYTGSHFSDAVQNGYEGSTPVLLGTVSGLSPVTGNDVNNFAPSGLTARYNTGTLTLPLPTPMTAANLSDPRLIEIPMVQTFGNGKSITLNVTGFITALLVPDGKGAYYGHVLSISLNDQIGSLGAPSTGTTTPVLIQ